MKLHIPDMACEGCARSVTKAITLLDGSAQVAVDGAARTVTVTTTAPQAAVMKALDEAGFPATAA